MSSQTKVEDLRLPATVIGRLVKDALPSNAAVSKEARTAIARAASVFILNMTTYANDYAQAKRRKMVTAEDVFQAVKVMECEQLEKPLKEAVELWKVAKAQKAEESKKKKAEKLLEKQKEGSETQESAPVVEDSNETEESVAVQNESHLEADDTMDSMNEASGELQQPQEPLADTLPPQFLEESEEPLEDTVPPAAAPVRDIEDGF